MKIIAEIDCESRHCGRCPVLDDVCFYYHSGKYCYLYESTLRETGRGVLRCKKCMDAEQAHEKLESLKTCNNCTSGPMFKCEKIKDCSKGWGTENLWESE